MGRHCIKTSSECKNGTYKQRPPRDGLDREDPRSEQEGQPRLRYHGEWRQCSDRSECQCIGAEEEEGDGDGLDGSILLPPASEG